MCVTGRRKTTVPLSTTLKNSAKKVITGCKRSTSADSASQTNITVSIRFHRSHSLRIPTNTKTMTSLSSTRLLSGSRPRANRRPQISNNSKIIIIMVMGQMRVGISSVWLQATPSKILALIFRLRRIRISILRLWGLSIARR